MLEIVIYIICASIVFYIIYYLLYKTTKFRFTAPQAQNNAPQARTQSNSNRNEEERKKRGGRGNRRMRRHLIEDDLSEDEEEKKINKKEMSKMLKKQEKEELREMREQMIQDRNEKMAKKERILDEKYDQKEKERIQNEAIFKKEEENKLKQGEQEYDLWKDTFQVQEDGILDDHQTHQDLLNQFLRYIQIRKVVLLDDLAAHFDLTTNDIVDRINELEKEGRLTGIIDDRGKYIFITPEELEKVEMFIKKKGRVSKTVLTKECNQIIRLHPTKADLEEIQNENKLLIEEMVEVIEQKEKNAA